MSEAAEEPKSWVPRSLLRFYARFPLVLLRAEEAVERPSAPELWIKPPWSASDWASADPACLRLQILLLQRGADVTFRHWANAEAAPGGTLPALRLPSGQLLPSPEIRSWLDAEYPLPEDKKALNGMPSEDAHASALAYSHIVLQKVHPAYLSLTSPPDTTLYLPYGQKLEVPASIYRNIPESIKSATGGQRITNRLIEQAGVEGIRTLGQLCRENVRADGWFLDAESSSPLDALIASHVYPISFLPHESSLVRALDEQPELSQYVRRVLDDARHT